MTTAPAASPPATAGSAAASAPLPSSSAPSHALWSPALRLVAALSLLADGPHERRVVVELSRGGLLDAVCTRLRDGCGALEAGGDLDGVAVGLAKVMATEEFQTAKAAVSQQQQRGASSGAAEGAATTAARHKSHSH